MTAVLLDIDGTLVDTNYQHVVAWYLAFRQHDVVVPLWHIHRHLGMGGDQLVAAVAGAEVEDACGDALRDAHDALYLASIDSVSAFEGASELVRELRESGRQVMLASSASEREVDHYLDLLGVRDLVDGWTTSADVDRTKPEPDLVQAALAKAQADEAVMIGDSPWDIEAAARAGVPTIAVLTGGFSDQELRDAGAVSVFESIAQLRAHLDDTALAAAPPAAADQAGGGR